MKFYQNDLNYSCCREGITNITNFLKPHVIVVNHRHHSDARVMLVLTSDTPRLYILTLDVMFFHAYVAFCFDLSLLYAMFKTLRVAREKIISLRCEALSK